MFKTFVYVTLFTPNLNRLEPKPFTHQGQPLLQITYSAQVFAGWPFSTSCAVSAFAHIRRANHVAIFPCDEFRQKKTLGLSYISFFMGNH